MATETMDRDQRRATETASDGPEANWAYRLGFWSAIAATASGVIYFLIILAALLTGNFTFPPSVPMQIFGGISSLVLPPVLVLLMASLHTVTPNEKKAYSQASLAFTLLFAGAVSINRFTQLGIVRHSQADGITAGIDWFLAYGEHSVMFGLEMLGWNWFLGLALLCAALLEREDRGLAARAVGLRRPALPGRGGGFSVAQPAFAVGFRRLGFGAVHHNGAAGPVFSPG